MGEKKIEKSFHDAIVLYSHIIHTHQFMNQRNKMIQFY